MGPAPMSKRTLVVLYTIQQFFFPFFFLVNTVLNTRIFFFPALSSNATVLSQAKGEVRTYFVNLVSTSYRENEKSGEVKEKEKERKR